MADARIPSGSQALPAVQPAARTEAVRAAQRAFFDAALTQAQAQPEIRRPVVTTAAAEASFSRGFTAPTGTPSERMLRPGSLLDIKV